MQFKRPTIDQFVNFKVAPYTHQVFRHYLSNQFEDKRRSIEAEISNDVRMQSFQKKLAWNGSGCSKIEPLQLAIWLLHRSEDVGEARARAELDSYLDCAEVHSAEVQFLVGLRLDASVDLVNEMRLIPLTELPDSDEKERYLSHPRDSLDVSVRPGCALEIRSVRPKFAEVDDESFKSAQSAINNRMRRVSLAINSMDEYFCFPAIKTGFLLPDVPPGMFSGRGANIPHFPLLPTRESYFSDADADDLREVVSSALSFDTVQWEILDRILLRIGSAKAQADPSQQALDIGIAAEMMLLGAEHRGRELPDSLSHHFRVRGAWFLGSDGASRKRIYNLL